MPEYSRSLKTGKPLETILGENGISKPTFYNWRKKYGGLEATELRRIKEPEEENARLKRMNTNLVMELDVAKYIIEKKL